MSADGKIAAEGSMDMTKTNAMTAEMTQMFDEAATKQFEITKAQTEGNLQIAAAKSKPNV